MASRERFEWLDSLQGSGIRPGLGRIRALLRTLGNPQRSCPSVIVAGTNGKGSTSATLNSIFLAAGYRTGLYTSPHLVDIRERWSIDGVPIDDRSLDQAIGALQDAARRIGITPTYFEALTIIAFLAFQRARCEVMVLEVGMGGRLDATNVVRPRAALITPIGLDHTEFLGSTIRKIAAEKAGVIHRGAIVLTSNDDPIVLSVLRKRAARFGNRFLTVGTEEGTEGPLPGHFQRLNAALAKRAAEELRPEFPGITEEAIRRGIAGTRWRGRLEKIERSGKTVWIDGCHNLHAAQAIAPFISARLPSPRLLVFGIMRDKDVDAVTALLFPMFDQIILTNPYAPRSAPASALRDRARALGVRARVVEEPQEAIDAALRSEIETILVAGSLYLAGAAIAHLDERNAQQRQ